MEKILKLNCEEEKAAADGGHQCLVADPESCTITFFPPKPRLSGAKSRLANCAVVMLGRLMVFDYVAAFVEAGQQGSGSEETDG